MRHALPWINLLKVLSPKIIIFLYSSNAFVYLLLWENMCKPHFYPVTETREDSLFYSLAWHTNKRIRVQVFYFILLAWTLEAKGWTSLSYPSPLLVKFFDLLTLFLAKNFITLWAATELLHWANVDLNLLGLLTLLRNPVHQRWSR